MEPDPPTLSLSLSFFSKELSQRVSLFPPPLFFWVSPFFFFAGAGPNFDFFLPPSWPIFHPRVEKGPPYFPFPPGPFSGPRGFAAFRGNKTLFFFFLLGFPQRGFPWALWGARPLWVWGPGEAPALARAYRFSRGAGERDPAPPTRGGPIRGRGTAPSPGRAPFF